MSMVRRRNNKKEEKKTGRNFKIQKDFVSGEFVDASNSELKENDDNLSKFLGQYPDHPDLGSVKEYMKDIRNGVFDADEFWDKKDRPFYKMIKGFYSTKPNSKEFNEAAVDIYVAAGKLWRVITGNTVNIKEDNEGKKILSNFYSGGVYMKFAAWLAVNSYFSNIFLNRKGILDIIPTMRPDVSTFWNNYIFMISRTMPEKYMNTLKKFVMDSEGNCELVLDYVRDQKSKNDTNKSEAPVDPAEMEHPEDDKPESNNSDDGKKVIKNDAPYGESKTIVDDSPKQEKKHSEVEKLLNIISKHSKNKESNEAKKNVIKDMSPKVKDVKHEEDPVEKLGPADAEVVYDGQKFTEEEKKDAEVIKPKNEESVTFKPNVKSEGYTFGKLKNGIVSTNGTEDAAGKAPDVPEEKPISNDHSKEDVDTENVSTSSQEDIIVDQYTDYNKEWEKVFPGLEGFTKIIHSTGLSVVYAAANNFPGLILVQIVDKTMNNNMGGVKRYLLIDPGMIYGDTMRIISTDRADGNLYREIYLTRNRKDEIIKLVTTGLTKEDRKRINESLPRSIYDVIDRVDMKDCPNIGFINWKYLIINISNVLRNLPSCRMRLIEVKSNNKFKLICDEKVISVYDNGIMGSDSHKEQLENKLYVDYDPEKYGDKLYYAGYMSGKELDFDPYKVMPKINKKKKEDDANKK